MRSTRIGLLAVITVLLLAGCSSEPSVQSDTADSEPATTTSAAEPATTTSTTADPEPTTTSPTPSDPEPTTTTSAAAEPEPTTTTRPTVATDAVIDEAYARMNESRQSAGLGVFQKAIEGDSAFVPIQEWIIGCYETADQHYDLMWPDIHAISLVSSPGGSECALLVTTYHFVPDSEKLRVERNVWECFSESRDIQEADNVSCGGRYSFITGHVRWLPSDVYYYIESGEGMRDDFVSYIPWIEEKLKVKVHEASSAHEANLFLHLDGAVPSNCLKRQGCNIYEDTGEKQLATIYIDAEERFFGQVLKHELLHALLPMGHLPPGNYLMSIRTDDPERTHTLSDLEEKLLPLYTHPYLRDGITMEQFSQYLIIE